VGMHGSCGLHAWFMRPWGTTIAVVRSTTNGNPVSASRDGFVWASSSLFDSIPMPSWCRRRTIFVVVVRGSY
jgi:hypothetical protein